MNPIMYRLPVFFSLLFLVLTSCGSAGSSTSASSDVKAELEKENRVGITLLNQIRRMPGIALRNGVPVFTKSTTDITAGIPIEPLYVLNGYPIGNSFADVDQLVDNVNVKEILALTDSEASFYGTRAANGVILITTYE